jgi:hypothetical protein
MADDIKFVIAEQVARKVKAMEGKGEFVEIETFEVNELNTQIRVVQWIDKEKGTYLPRYFNVKVSEVNNR